MEECLVKKFPLKRENFELVVLIVEPIINPLKNKNMSDEKIKNMDYDEIVSDLERKSILQRLRIEYLISESEQQLAEMTTLIDMRKQELEKIKRTTIS